MPFEEVDTCGPPVPILALMRDPETGRHYLRLPRIATELDDAGSVKAFYAGKASVGQWSDMRKFLFVIESDGDTMILEDASGCRLRVLVETTCPPGSACE